MYAKNEIKSVQNDAVETHFSVIPGTQKSNFSYKCTRSITNTDVFMKHYYSLHR